MLAGGRPPWWRIAPHSDSSSASPGTVGVFSRHGRPSSFSLVLLRFSPSCHRRDRLVGLVVGIVEALVVIAVVIGILHWLDRWNQARQQ